MLILFLPPQYPVVKPKFRGQQSLWEIESSHGGERRRRKPRANTLPGFEPTNLTPESSALSFRPLHPRSFNSRSGVRFPVDIANLISDSITKRGMLLTKSRFVRIAENFPVFWQCRSFSISECKEIAFQGPNSRKYSKSKTANTLGGQAITTSCERPFNALNSALRILYSTF